MSSERWIYSENDREGSILDRDRELSQPIGSAPSAISNWVWCGTINLQLLLFLNHCSQMITFVAFYTVLGMLSNLRWQSKQKQVWRSSANIAEFYIRHLSICAFWDPQGSWNQFPLDIEGELCCCSRLRKSWQPVLPLINNVCLSKSSIEPQSL